MSTIGKAIGGEFRRILSESKLSVSQAARDLGISRQAFHNYLNGTSIPRAQTLSRAMDLWGFSLTVSGMMLDRNSLIIERKDSPQPRQLKLWEVLDEIKPEDLKIEVKRIGSTLNVEVKIDIPA